jgi:acylphosphatase
VNPASATIKISGRVQGVGFRYFCYRRGVACGLAGWVRNDPDGSVSILAEGDRAGIERYIEELKAGPPAAVVADVDVDWREFSGRHSSFEILM